MFNSPTRPGFSKFPRPMFNKYEEKMSAPNNAYYVLTQPHAGLPNSVLFSTAFAAEDLANLGTKSHTVLSDIGTNTHAQVDTHIADNTIHFADLSGFDTGDLSEGANLYYTDVRVDTYGDTQWLKLDGSNANSNINLGAYDFTTTGTGTFGTLAVGTAYTFPTADGAANEYLETDGAGNLSWTAAAPVGYVRSATLIVAASDSADTTNADYFCDGTADEVQINAAIAALPATGGSVVLMDGTYDVDSSILINKSRVSLIGQGKNTIIETDTAIRIMDTSTNSRRCLIRDIYIKGINALNCYGIYLDGDYHNIIHCYFAGCFYNLYMTDNYNIIFGCHFQNGEYGIYFASAVYNQIAGCNFRNNKYHNYFASAASYNQITGSSFWGGQYGAHFINGIKNTIVGNTSSECSVAFAYLRVNCHRNIINGNVIAGGSQAIYLKSADFNTINGNMLTNNSIGIYVEDGFGNNVNGNTGQDTSGTYGIWIKTGGGNNIIGNNFTKIDRHGIYLYNTSNNIVSNNNIHDCSEDANDTYSGIYLAGTSTYNTITGNRIHADAANKHQYGIREAAAADDYNNITGNTCTDAVTANISLQGLNDEVGHNIAP